MLFQDISAQIIKESQIQAKWQNDTERRYLANFALDMYNGLYFDYLNKKIDDTVDGQGDLAELRKYIDTMMTTKNVVDDISKIFDKAPDIELMINGEAHDVYTEALAAILDNANFNVILTELNRLTNLLYDMIAVPVTRNGKIEIDLITSDRVFIESTDCDPTTAETLFYQIGELPNDLNRESRSDLYMACNKAGKKLVEVKQHNGKQVIFDYVKDNDFNDDTQYPCNPAVVFRNYYPLSTFWHPGLNPLIEKDLNNDFRLTEYNMARAYQLPALVTIGIDSSQKITKGQKSRINIPPALGGTPGSASYLVPDQKLDILGKQIYDADERLKLSYHMSKSTITGQTATSGYELSLSKAELLDWNNSQQKYYDIPIKQLISCIIAMSKKYKLANFPDNYEINIKYAEQKFIETPKERIARQQLEVVSGVKNLIDIEIENSGGVIDRVEALRIVTERKNELKELNAIDTPIFEQIIE